MLEDGGDIVLELGLQGSLLAPYTPSVQIEFAQPAGDPRQKFGELKKSSYIYNTNKTP